MKKTILIAALFLLSLNAQAQRHDTPVVMAYPAIGMTFSQIEGDALKGFAKYGFTAGVGAKINLGRSEMFKLSLETDFYQRGSFSNTGNPYSINLPLNYVDIPLMFHFTDPYGGMTFGAGLSYGRLVQQPHGDMHYSNSFIPDTSNFHFLSNDLSIILGFQFTIWRGLKFDIRYQRSLIPVKKDMAFDTLNILTHERVRVEQDLYNSSVSARLIYVFGDDGHKPKPGYLRHHKSHRHKAYRRRR